MKFLLALGILLLIAISFFADYKWKRWMAARKQEHESSSDRRA